MSAELASVLGTSIAADFLPTTDGTYDLGSSSLQWEDLYIDGTAFLDTATIEVGDLTMTAGDVVLGTTDHALGSDADSKTVKVCGGTAGTGCDAEGVGAWLVLEGTDFGGSTVGGAIQLEGGAGDATADVKIGTNHDDADILLAGGTTQATKWTITGDTGTFIGTGTGTIGWTVQSSANQACSTTCTTPCVVGWDTSGTESALGDCADAGNDECLCAGAS